MSEPTKIGDGAVQPGLPRLRTCLRCERNADEAEKAGYPRPPVNEVQSLVSMGIRYYSATCVRCADLERETRRRLREQAQVKKGNDR